MTCWMAVYIHILSYFKCMPPTYFQDTGQLTRFRCRNNISSRPSGVGISGGDCSSRDECKTKVINFITANI